MESVARYTVQVALQYEFSQFDIPTNFTTGYIPLGSKAPDEYPSYIYGTEVFEFNQNLQHWAAQTARKARLKDDALSKIYRAHYAEAYPIGGAPPAVYECDGATSDNYFHGITLSETFANYTRLITNGSGVYCTTAQEDST